MVRNPVWSKPLSDYLADFRRWVALPDETAHMNVAIFYDARAVAGDAQLLTTAKAALIDLIRGEQAYLAHFARAVDALATPIGLFNNLVTSEGKGDALDLKKGGIFPIVHGVRSLARSNMACWKRRPTSVSRGCATSASCKPTSPAS